MGIEIRPFGKLPDGTAVDCCTLKNSGGMSAELLTYGCRIAKLFVPDKDGKFENVVLGHDTLAEYAVGNDVFGAVVGRYANRIGGAQFQIGGKTYHVNKNEGGKLPAQCTRRLPGPGLAHQAQQQRQRFPFRHVCVP